MLPFAKLLWPLIHFVADVIYKALVCLDSKIHKKRRKVNLSSRNRLPLVTGL